MPRDDRRDEDDDDRPRRRDRDDDDDRPRRRDRDDDMDGSAPKKMSVLGLLALIQGIGSAVVSIIPCVGALGIIGGLVGLLLGIIGWVMASKSKNVGKGLPIAGTIVSAIAVIFGGIWLAVTAAFFQSAKNAADEYDAKVTAARAKETAEVKDGPAVTVTATTLQKDYDANQLSADTKYKSKVLEVSGTVAKVAREKFDTITVELKTGSGGDTIECEFAKADETKLAALKPGDQVKIRGKCKGKYIGTVTLERCLLMN
ncbi:MAG TPA: hypothetical protein VHR66_25910 [Gemmataceae bacterium]|jgi:hypothetical protein|nr:hypothetical protein [Gemmataceae bacterium]